MQLKINKNFLILFVLNLLLYLPSLFEPISYGDECIYLTLGNAFRKGLVFYRDIHDNKPPFLYLVAALTDSFRLFRFLTIIWNLTHLYIILRLLENLTKNKITPLVGGLIFSFLLLIFEGRVANGEVYMMMPITLAVYLLLTRINRKDFSFGFLIGLLFSVGFLFKVPVFFDFIGIIFAFFFLSIESPIFQKSKKNRFGSLFKKTISNLIYQIETRKLIGIILGFSLSILISIVYYGSKGALIPYVRSALMQNIGYLSSWQGTSSGLIFRILALGFFSILLFWQRKKFPFPLLAFFIWFIFGLFGALLSSRPYPHYLIEIVPSLTTLVTITLDKLSFKPKVKVNQKAIKSVLLAWSAITLLIFSYIHFKFWWYEQIPYYKNFIRYAIGTIDKEEYYRYWGEKTLNNYLLADFINKTVKKEESIFIWGDAACIYAISNHQPPGRYTVNYHIFDFNGFRETIEAIQKKEPRLIIKLNDEKTSWPELDSYIGKYYYKLLVPSIKDSIFIRNHKLSNKIAI